MDTKPVNEREFLKKIMKRPGVYVGANRLDYVQQFYSGYCCCESERNETALTWDENYDLQRWLLLNQSVSLLSAQMGGWRLFYLCFGVKKTAI